jgi:hypothetical protein
MDPRCIFASVPSTDRCIPLAARTEWEQALEAVPHVFGQTWGSCHALSLDGDPVMLYAAAGIDARVVCPLIERPIEGRLDVATPYGFSGLAGTGPWTGFAERWQQFADERGYVAGYLAINALFGDDSYADPDDTTIVNDTFVLDLRNGVEGVAAGLSTNRRRQLREWGPEMHEIDSERLADFFVEQYPLAMKRKGAAERHRFSPATLMALCDLPNTFLVGAVTDGTVESVSLFGHSSHAGDFLFNAALPDCQHHSAALIWSAVHRLVELGVPWLNLGGGMSPGDSLAEFKARFGASPLPMRAVKAVYDRAAYAELCRERGADPDDRDGFFPAYRDA